MWHSVPPLMVVAGSMVVALLAMCLLLKLLLVEDEPMNVFDLLTYWLLRIALAIAAVSYPVYWYPEFERWMHLEANMTFYHGLTPYVVGPYGVIHYASVILVITITAGLLLVPHVANLAEFAARAIVKELQRNQAEVVEEGA